MNEYLNVRKLCREAAVVTAVDVDDELFMLRKMKEMKRKTVECLTAQQTNDKDKLIGI